MSYKRTVWVNDGLPAINAENLNKIENGIVESDMFRNLFNKNVIGYNLSGASKSIVDGAIRITSILTASNASIVYLIPFGRKEMLGKTITLSGSWVSSANKSGRMYIGASDENFTNRHPYIALENSGESVTVTLPTSFTGNNVCFFLALYACYDESITAGDYVDYTNVQIEESTTPTSYIPWAGYIVESGSNDNGRWIKYSDGSMICYGSKDVTFDCSQAWGNLFIGRYESYISFSQEFIDIPLLQIHTRSTTNASSWLISYDKTTVSKSNFYEVDIARATANSSVPITIIFIAIGRWK